MANAVKMIGICGHPLHGKSTAQSFLSRLGVKAIDDSEPLRREAMREFDLTWRQVSTQEGKAELVDVYGTLMTVRQAIGDLGKVYERKHGPNYWIERAIASVANSRSPVSFGSVRMGQAHAIRAAGGIALAIDDPRRPRSQHDFDQFDPAGVDTWISNDSDLGTFQTRVLLAVGPYLEMNVSRFLPCQVHAK